MKNLSAKLYLLVVLTLGLSVSYVTGQENLSYQTPPKAIQDLVDAPQLPSVSISPDGKWLLLAERPSMPAIEEVAQPELRIGGLRINPQTNGQSRDFYYSIRLTLVEVETGESFPVKALPEKAHMGNISWSPDGTHCAFTQTESSGIELWIVSLSSQEARRLTEANVNAAMRGRPYDWAVDGKSLVYKAIPSDRGEAPVRPSVPAGPVVSENVGTEAPNRTYQDLLKSPFDEALFEYYTYSQLVQVTLEGAPKKWGKPGMFSSLEPSPNGAYWLVEQINRPFSYLVPYYRFANRVEIWDDAGAVVKKVADIPVSEDIPKGFGAVRIGPRSHAWRSDLPATLYWVEAQDGGDPNKQVAVRDRLYYLEAPFSGSPTASVEMELRYAGMDWVHEELAFSYEYWFKTRQQIVREFNPKDPEGLTDIVFDLSTEDRYSDPGDFVSTRNNAGHSVLLTNSSKSHLYLIGVGASQEGNRPFIDAYTLSNGKTTRHWQSEAPYYEYPVEIIDPDQGLFISRRESTSEPQNYFLRNWHTGTATQLTFFKNPYPSMEDVEIEELSYSREDGVSLTGTLYTPPGYKLEDGPLPAFIWAYPREFKSAAHAGQRSDSPYRFPRISSGSPIFWVMRGFAVLNNASMPIVGEGSEEPNDSFVDQLVMNAEAAIDKLVELGIGDRNRMAIGGHSYGAFMTANLLAHSDLFAAGIARSGAYNRTMTPFGFQREERTYWEAPEIYFQMSPFMHAQKVNEPILLIHGMADNNSGTFPMQSERFYNALKGHGATTRLVMLPHESHGYRGRESVLHMLWEMDQWLEKHVNQKQ